ncbi:MAG: malto-oligosyltrehalose trehalohydrolase [Bryobacterales bacterium]|nr:malto-oligosyltrehalose trehalohydrolase [Bryobacterales bacterium]
MTDWEPVLGANVFGNATRFRVWAPEAKRVDVALESEGSAHAMAQGADGFHAATLPGVSAGARYRYRVDGRGPFPDPASRYQPEGVHGPSEVVDWRHFPWTDGGWKGLDLAETVVYELHTGTFTAEGTFAGAAAKLSYLKELGVTAVELMPVADFPGRWNWGYDGVAPFAPARCYGTPDDLRRLVNAAHRLGLAVYLDVVYNHLGPDGAYQSTFSRFYYSTTHRSPWGAGINFDGPQSEAVRDYMIENALGWIHEYHFDGLRLDATHAIVDDSRRHILASIASAVHCSLEGGRKAMVVAEDVRNLASMLRPEREGGWGLDGAWSDDFHHQMRRAVAGDCDGYFQDFDGTAESIAVTARKGWFYTGQHASYFGGARGTETDGLTKDRFIFCIQNHDQIGNRAFGERLHHQIDEGAWRAASALLLMLPETPLLFMGQEWAATAPFLYFTDHHEELGRQVTEGRRREFRRFAAFADPETRERIPDPQSEGTFLRSRLDWEESRREPHAAVWRLYQRLLRLRRGLIPAEGTVTAAGDDSILVERTVKDGTPLLGVVRLRGSGAVSLPPEGRWRVLFTTEDPPYVNESASPPVLAGQRVEFSGAGAAVLAGERKDSYAREA